MHHSRFRDSMMQYTKAPCVLDQRPMCPGRARKVNGQAASCARPRSQPSRFRKKRKTATQRRTKAMPATRYFSKPSPKSPKGMTTCAAAGVMTAAKETTRRERRNPWCNSSPQQVSNRWIEGVRDAPILILCSHCAICSWRRGRDSNPRYPCEYAAFRVRCFQPLSHLSGI